MGIVELGSILRNQWKLIFIIFFITLLLGGVLSFYVIKPVYQAKATLLVQSQPSGNQIAYNDLVTNQNLVKTYVDIFKSRKITEDVIKRANLTITSEELLKKVKFHAAHDSLVTGVIVEDTSPEKAVQLANSFVYSFKDNLSSIMKVDNVSILDLAGLEEVSDPVRPKPVINLAISFVLGLMLGVVSAVLIELINNNNRIRSEQDLEGKVGLTPFGTIFSFDKKLMRSKGVISEYTLHSPVSEAYRTIRTNLHYDEQFKSSKLLMVTSSFEMEGKTITITNLAITIALTGKRVLVIDGDMRRPSVHRNFLVPNERGLSDVLADPSQNIKEMIVNVRNGLDILTAGCHVHNPSELISGGTISEILGNLSEEYDMILLDTPPILLVPDAQIFATSVEGVLVVVKAEKIQINQLLKTKALLERVGAKVIGAVLNNKPVRNQAKYSYYSPNESKSKASS